jgi:hypothetical protein
VQANGIEGNAAWMDFASYQSAQNQMDILLSPWFRTDSWNPGEALPSLSFDLFYRKKTSFPSFQDTLAIFIAEPCEGGDILITEIFREGGEGLYTNDQIQVNAFPTGSEDWSSISIALNDAGISVEDLDDFYVQFVGINRNGNNLLIDNINISWSESVSTESAENIEVNMYPNPAQDAVFFNWSGNYDKAAFRLHDLQGRLVGSENVVLSGEPVQLPTLVSGLYLATLSFADGNERVVKLVIQ